MSVLAAIGTELAQKDARIRELEGEVERLWEALAYREDENLDLRAALERLNLSEAS